MRKSSDFIRQNSVSCKFGSDSWAVLSSIEQRIKSKIESVGTPLKDWDINIYRGILTGYNEAFVIDGKKRDELIKEDPKSAEIIQPILRGRDIKRYGYDFADIYLITTFPSLKINIEQYPAIKQHLLHIGYDRLKQTGEPGARKKTTNKWFETQDSINYWEDFSKQKIVWLELTDKPKFSIDLNKMYCLAGTFLLTSNEGLYTILAALNSKLIEWLFDGMCNSSGTGTNQWKKFVVERIPIPKSNARTEEQIKKLLQEKNYNELNKMVYELYGLDNDEIKFIESQ